ncbi:ATP/cobalamin adenosyltransferase [Dethiosulfovibrio peptidovorans DSM 11002]|uniref:Corrinoid adenosyltransferase n=1 Tax=Dethiosulfovibrio peptidovorans DSM 11002 TaxID=469381 RepID=D2Z8K6_9BACT|nr:cob(I)yrinic acid a,c-diamide adenosyltransferase [Dethiosulfovibrio peptidovorans]EFC91803.1 ATP/cobalamin adenosyltransferase [Dethiosulfovibrio peptidovorans DSM 11002]
MYKMTITTKGGDKGNTSLCNGERVPKDDPRVEAYGTIDECQASIGLARSMCSFEPINENLKRLEDELYTLMGCMALCEGMEPPKTDWMEDMIKEVSSMFTEGEFQFIRPGECSVCATLHMARTIARRAERQAVRMLRSGTLPLDIFAYINRLSDAIYALILWYQKEFFPAEGK